MNLIALLFGIWIEQQLAHLLHLREARWFDAYFDWGMRRMNGATTAQTLTTTVLLAVVPVLPVAGIAWFFWGKLLGVPYLAFALSVLFSLGPRVSSDVEDYTRALAQRTSAARPQRAKALTEREAPTDPHERGRAVEEAIFVQANNRMFGVILWFMLLGPTGAWLFRVTDLMRRRAVFEGARAREQTGATPDYVQAAQRAGVLRGAGATARIRLRAAGASRTPCRTGAPTPLLGHFFEVNEAVLSTPAPVRCARVPSRQRPRRAKRRRPCAARCASSIAP
jgi:AmpE protein